MKTTIPILLFGLIALIGRTQTQDSITMGPNYTNDVFYSLANGQVTSVSNTDWDLAFSLTGSASTIRINGQEGVELYLYENGDTADWNNPDTTGLSTWNVLYNSDTSWAIGAFNRYTASSFDLGWGIYNQTTHIVTGDSIYIAELPDGSWKKIRIRQLSGGTYTFSYGDLNAGNEITVQITKSNYSGKNFVYYSMRNNSILDREPAADWDIVFTPYISEISPGTFYGVTGVLQNTFIETGESRGVPVANASFTSQSFETRTNVIGYDWKNFDMSCYCYVLEDSLAYFVKDANGDVWKLVFDDFKGNSTGKAIFTKEKVSATYVAEVSDPAKNGIKAFPNPSSGQFTLEMKRPIENDATLQVMDIAGKVVHERSIFPSEAPGTMKFDLNDLKAGFYILRLNSPERTYSSELIIR